MTSDKWGQVEEIAEIITAGDAVTWVLTGRIF